MREVFVFIGKAVPDKASERRPRARFVVTVLPLLTTLP